ncbi:hypothetical protein HKX48_001368, partial [Thoreauomyces humboldtii]
MGKAMQKEYIKWSTPLSSPILIERPAFTARLIVHPWSKPIHLSTPDLQALDRPDDPSSQRQSQSQTQTSPPSSFIDPILDHLIQQYRSLSSTQKHRLDYLLPVNVNVYPTTTTTVVARAFRPDVAFNGLDTLISLVEKHALLETDLARRKERFRREVKTLKREVRRLGIT